MGFYGTLWDICVDCMLNADLARDLCGSCLFMLRLRKPFYVEARRRGPKPIGESSWLGGFFAGTMPKSLQIWEGGLGGAYTRTQKRKQKRKLKCFFGLMCFPILERAHCSCVMWKYRCGEVLVGTGGALPVQKLRLRVCLCAIGSDHPETVFYRFILFPARRGCPRWLRTHARVCGVATASACPLCCSPQKPLGSHENRSYQRRVAFRVAVVE